MTCYNHPGMGTEAVCDSCGKECCVCCVTRVGKRTVCRDCAEVLRPLEPPEPVEVPPENPGPAGAAPEPPTSAEAAPGEPGPAVAPPAEPKPEEKAPAEPPVTLPALSRPSGVAVQAKPKPPAVADPGVGGPREKESLLSAALSFILPGMGQAYNGQIVKGVILAVLYLGSLAAILISILATAVYAPGFCCACLPAFVLPMIVLAYAIYDAYETAERINNGLPVRDWF